MKWGVVVAAAIGFAVAIYLIAHIGIGAVFAALTAVGWVGFALLCLMGFCLVALLGAAWGVLVDDRRQGAFLFGRLVRDSAGELLPFSQLGGIVIGARAVMLRGVPPTLAFASAIADVTTEMMAQLVFIAFGVLLLIDALRATASTAPLTNGLLIGLVVGGPLIASLVFLQRRGSQFAHKLAVRFLPSAVEKAESFGLAINAIYESPARLAASSFLHLIGWAGSGVLTWLSIRLMGAHIDLLPALAIEAVLCALRSAAIFVPAAIGVQEAGYALLMPLFGLGPEVGLAVSLLKRAREIVIGVPILLTWQAMEGRRAFAKEN